MSFVGGVIQHRAKSPFAKGVWGWPFGRVDLREDDVFAHTPVFFGHWPLRVPYAEINEAVVRRYRWGGKIRLLRSAPTGDVTITTVGQSYVAIAALLRENGVHVASSD
jgi:hypothetical protein